VHLIEEETPYRYLAIRSLWLKPWRCTTPSTRIDGRRPGTHEVMAEVLRRLNADIVAARITRYDAGVFYAELDLMTPRVTRSSTVARVTLDSGDSPGRARSHALRASQCCKPSTRRRPSRSRGAYLYGNPFEP